jgi:hypothetical protein
MKFWSIFLFCAIFLQISSYGEEWINFKFKSVRCKIMEPSYVKVNKCFVKPISRNISFLNLDYDILKIVRGPIFVEVELFLRYVTIFRPIYPKVKFDFCAVMRGDGVFEKFVYFIIGMFKDSVPQLFHKCPFMGHLSLPNVTFNVKSVPVDRLMPAGLYRCFLGIFQDKTYVTSVDIHIEISSKLDRF